MDMVEVVHAGEIVLAMNRRGSGRGHQRRCGIAQTKLRLREADQHIDYLRVAVGVLHLAQALFKELLCLDKIPFPQRNLAVDDRPVEVP